MPLKIAIIGAGPAGCTLARILHVKNSSIQATIFESEGSINFRSQGGTLDLHVGTGQLAIQEAGLWDEFQKQARYDGEATQIADKNYLCYVKMGAGNSSKSTSTGRPEIDRSLLRELLYNSLPKGMVQWSKKLKEVKRAGAELELHFADGSTAHGYDLIVGADGTWSKTRSLVTDIKPFYSGIAGHTMSIPDAAARHPTLYDAVARGTIYSYSDGKSLILQQMGDGSLLVGTWSAHSPDWQQNSGYDVHDPVAVKAAYRKQYADWHPTLRAFTQEADDDTVAVRDLFMLPIGNRWQHVPGITLVGDAAHVMTPFAGEGVNLAFADCVDLSRAILSAAASLPSADNSEARDLSEDANTTSQATGGTALDVSVRAFEEVMFARAKKYQQLTYDLMSTIFFSPGAPRAVIEKYLLRMVGESLGYWGTVLATPVVYAWFLVFKLIW
ncbi:hypothetical protein LTR91_022531 [Friedmanniomyces endolithicus]|uniref:FAD-binding domain-containing protein n=1 Tax=Friedmanniomyces endolithicus TaxID=329885 RepID=A0AAN6H5S5_9PEZI|nr:hypothetical protein LTR94_008597 [Friedmanniomyces endolithicus]KAK0791253.1 hypothetical protein LTR59_008978 [Friedmanniomyces endolithicus]KAK0797514.1 hypothetical protein LTR38_008217 [Friedmanniomyces endolithicus]KAK0816273.1 hypothetical protein LTR75_003497 [Friedmanniomyces endolithicus]KAK0840745.1 hypothetical protein LTS02_017083 [Friedmanniomyces endolithicus]